MTASSHAAADGASLSRLLNNNADGRFRLEMEVNVPPSFEVKP